MRDKNLTKAILFLMLALLLTLSIFYWLENQRKKQLQLELAFLKGTIQPGTLRIERVIEKNSFDEALAIVRALKHKVENEDAYKIFYTKNGKQKKATEKDIHYLLSIAASFTKFDINHEPNNGLGAPDFTFSYGQDKTVVEIKLASNRKLKNIKAQVEAYTKSNKTDKSVIVIVAFTEKQEQLARKTLAKNGLENTPGVFLIDARYDNKPTGSNRT